MNTIDAYEMVADLRPKLEAMSPGERAVLADMLMRSLRGSWRQPKPRTMLLNEIARTGDLAVYDADDLEEKVDQYRRMWDWDGRHFRGFYQDHEFDYLDYVDEAWLREWASRIPDDMTWNARRLNQLVEDANE